MQHTWPKVGNTKPPETARKLDQHDSTISSYSGSNQGFLWAVSATKTRTAFRQLRRHIKSRSPAASNWTSQILSVTSPQKRCFVMKTHSCPVSSKHQNTTQMMVVTFNIPLWPHPAFTLIQPLRQSRHFWRGSHCRPWSVPRAIIIPMGWLLARW